jgi:hypothetical protein
MGGQGQAPNSFHQAQMQHQFNQVPGQQQQYQQHQQSNYIANNQQYSQQPPAAAPSYYTQQAPQQQPPAQQQQQQQQQPVVHRPPAQGSYAARSAAANSPHGSMHNSSPHPSAHGSNSGSAHGQPNQTESTAHLKGQDPAFLAEQTRLLTNATRKVVDASLGMNRAIEENDAVGVLEMACIMLEELGDPNHGVKGQVR